MILLELKEVYDIDDCHPSFKEELEKLVDMYWTLIVSLSDEKLDVNNNSKCDIKSEQTDKNNTNTQ